MKQGRYTPKEKLDIIAEASRNGVATTATAYGIHDNTLRRWTKEQDDLQYTAENFPKAKNIVRRPAPVNELAEHPVNDSDSTAVEQTEVKTRKTIIKNGDEETVIEEKYEKTVKVTRTSCSNQAKKNEPNTIELLGDLRLLTL